MIDDRAEGPRGLVEVLSRLDSLTRQDSVELRQIVKAFGEAGFVPMLLAPAIIVVSPLSGIPFLPTIFGTVIALVSAQMIAGRRHLWLPEMLMRRRIGGRGLAGALKRSRRAALWIDSNSRDRLPLLVRPPLDLLPKALCFFCGAAMPFLELVPFSSSLLGAAVVLMGTGMLARDGLFTLLAGAFIGIAASVPVIVWGEVLLGA